MKKKKISLIISLFVVLTLLVGYIASYAVDKTLGKVTLSAVDANGIGYSNGDPGNGGGFSSQKIWNFKINGAVTTRNIYCVKGGYGETWGSDENNELTYNLSYDFQQDRNKLISSLTTQEGTLVKDLLDNTKYYRELLWLFDNYFLPGDNKTTYLEKMYDAKYSYDARYNPTSRFDWDDNTYVEFNDNLTDADIIAVQRSVIWYFTNYKLDGTDKYNHVDNSTDKNQLRASWLKITENNGQSYNNLNSDRIKSMLSFIHKNYNKQITLNDISKSVNLSERECLRCFKNTLGISPIQYILKYRVSIATKMLRENKDPITIISDAVGFDSPSYFSKIFKRFIGITPTQYRNKSK